MARKMTGDERRAFVPHGTRTAGLSPVRADGSPEVTPVWFLLDGDEVVINTGKPAVKGRDLARDGDISCVRDVRPPFDRVVPRPGQDPGEPLGASSPGGADRGAAPGRGARRGVRPA